MSKQTKPTEIEFKAKYLKERVERIFPNLRENLENPEKKDEVIVFHQDQFAKDYDTVDYITLGMVVKYIGIYGRAVQIVGQNRETLNAINLIKKQ